MCMWVCVCLCLCLSLSLFLSLSLSLSLSPPPPPPHPSPPLPFPSQASIHTPLPPHSDNASYCSHRARTSMRRWVRPQRLPWPCWTRNSTSTTQTRAGWTSARWAPCATTSFTTCGARSSPWSSLATASPWASTACPTSPPRFLEEPACLPRWVGSVLVNVVISRGHQGSRRSQHVCQGGLAVC